jgi:LDH2 family malate/lactate/ureidoglycolate dehydrogenase
MTLGRLRLSVADAHDLAEGALRGIGYHNDEARIIADHVIDAAMCGYEYSGLAKILNVFESDHFLLPRRSMKVLRETEVSLAFDGSNNVGMLALFHAAQATIKKTAAHGIALVSVTDAWMSGRGAYYVEMIAKHGLVAIHTAASSRLVAPPGGIRDRVRLLTALRRAPLEEAVHRQDAAPARVSVAKSRQAPDRLRLCVDRFATALRVFAPVGNEAPFSGDRARVRPCRGCRE